MQKSHAGALIRVGGVVLAGLVLVLTFRTVDTSRLSLLLSQIPAAALLLLALPQLLALCLESLGWQWVFDVIGRPVRYWPLLQVRLATEALAQSLPGGPLWSESMKPVLLGRYCGLGVPESLTGVAARKVLLLWAHAAYLSIALGLGLPYVSDAFRQVMGRSGGEWAILLAAVGLGLAALLASGTFARGKLAERLLRALRRIPIGRLRRALDAGSDGFLRTDLELARFFRTGPTASLPTVLLFLAGWLLEAVETFLILRLLGVDLPFEAVIGMEVVVSLLRNVLFVLPAGLGVQDLGYVMFLTALGVPDPLTTGAAFSLLKRGKELFWISVGYALLFAGRAAPRSQHNVTRAIDSRLPRRALAGR